MRRSADGQRSADSCFLLFFLFFSCFVQFFPVCPAHQPAAVAGSDSGFWTLIEPAGPSELPFGDTSGPVPPVHSACLLLGSVFDLCPLFITRPPSFPLICPSSCLYSLTSVLQIWTQRGSGSQQLPVSQKIPLFPPPVFPLLHPPAPQHPCGTFPPSAVGHSSLRSPAQTHLSLRTRNQDGIIPQRPLRQQSRRSQVAHRPPGHLDQADDPEFSSSSSSSGAARCHWSVRTTPDLFPPPRLRPQLSVSAADCCPALCPSPSTSWMFLMLQIPIPSLLSSLHPRRFSVSSQSPRTGFHWREGRVGDVVGDSKPGLGT